jgi:hypothetical protein
MPREGAPPRFPLDVTRSFSAIRDSADSPGETPNVNPAPISNERRGSGKKGHAPPPNLQQQQLQQQQQLEEQQLQQQRQWEAEAAEEDPDTAYPQRIRVVVRKRPMAKK